MNSWKWDIRWLNSLLDVLALWFDTWCMFRCFQCSQFHNPKRRNLANKAIPIIDREVHWSVVVLGSSENV